MINDTASQPIYNAHFFRKENVDLYLQQFKGKPDIHFLEIGAFEGYSANYFIDNFLTGEGCTITCVDPWIKYSKSTVAKISGRDELINENTYHFFLRNTEYNREKIIVKRGFSKDVVPLLDKQYHFVLIDGDHSEDAVWVDAQLSFSKLLSGGILIFDDYEWRGGAGKQHPKKAVNRFLKEYESHINVLDINKQVVVQKN